MANILDKWELRKRNRTAAGQIAGIVTTQLGDTIADNNTRFIWRMRISNNVNSAQVVEIYQGDTALPTRTLIDRFTVPAYGIVGLGERIEDPEHTVRPNTTVSPTQGNKIYINVIAAPADFNVRLSQYDLR